MDGLRILEHAGDEYLRLVNNAKWTLACLNYAPRFDERNIRGFERHNLSEETFVLLDGEAKLWMRDGSTVAKIPLEPKKFYNVGAGVWHNISVTPGSRVLVAENSDTGKDNTEYLDFGSDAVYSGHPRFEEVLPGTYLLKVPFGPVWTGINLIRLDDGRYVMIDSSHLTPERYLVPALNDLGVKPADIAWLLNTHVHGDHIGGHRALVDGFGLKTATLKSAADALRDPVSVAVRVRTRFPENSPAPQSYLKGVEPDRLLGEEELLENRFRVIATPGHDDDCLTWIDTKTKTAFTGDSLQANGTPCQGVGFYRSLPAYRATLAKLKREELENIVCGHAYDGIGDVIRGAEAVRGALDYCVGRVELYGERIRGYVSEGVSVEPEPVTLARRLIGDVGCGTPAALFLALHTVSEHLREM